MKLPIFGLGVSAGFFLLALLARTLMHDGDMLFLIVSGMLIASVSVVGFDIPSPTRKLAALLLLMGCLIFASGVLIAISGHAFVLFSAALPALGLVLFGLHQYLAAGDETGQ